MRAQANFAEYAPTFLIMLALAEAQGLPAWHSHAFGALFWAGRVSHFAGFRTSDARSVFRVAGMALTFIPIGGLVLVILLQWVT